MKTYHLIIVGCQMNYSDTERIANQLEELGYQKTEECKKADLVILTTCGVRQKAEDRIYGFAPRIKKDNPNTFLILTGCLSERPDVRERLRNSVDLWLPTIKIPELKKILTNNTDLGSLKIFSEEIEPKNYLSLKPKYSSSFSAFIPIGNGCDNFCAYCVVPRARGREIYRSYQEILNEIKNLIDQNYKEITLIAQNVNSYQDGQINFPGLLKMANAIEGDFWLRFSTNHPKDFSDELIEIIGSNKKICPHIHLPIQSGDNEILAKMNRKYTQEDYQNLVNKLRAKINPESDLPLAISTDAIVGFPGETEEQFQNTVKLFQAVKFDMAYLSQYSPRPQTPAYYLKDDISSETKKERENILNQILKETARKNNQWYLDKTILILIDKKTKDGYWIGKTKTFKTVKIQSENNNLLGQVVKVKINHIADFGMEGTVNL